MFYHGYCTVEFEVILADLQAFMSEHPKEIVILSFSRVYVAGGKKMTLEQFKAF